MLPIVFYVNPKNADMETIKPGSHPIPVLTQAENNTTLWIGHLPSDPTDHYAGQTFTCPSDGLLDNIQLYTSSVHSPGEIQLSLHEFDEKLKTWGPSIATSSTIVEREDDKQWIRFELPPVQLQKATTYGFQVYTSNAMVGLGEAACDSRHPFTFGHEWNGDSTNQKGNYFSYFSLTFKIEMRA
jgi:hypothetical protein